MWLLGDIGWSLTSITFLCGGRHSVGVEAVRNRFLGYKTVHDSLRGWRNCICGWFGGSRVMEDLGLMLRKCFVTVSTGYQAFI